jgi:hypothetical protein
MRKAADVTGGKPISDFYDILGRKGEVPHGDQRKHFFALGSEGFKFD